MITYLSEKNLFNLIVVSYLAGVAEGHRNELLKTEGKEMSNILDVASDFAVERIEEIKTIFENIYK